MDEKILIYIVIGILYFLFNRLKKKDTSNDEREVERPSQPSQQARPLTFEELLKEITEGKQQTPLPPVQQQKPGYQQVPQQVPQTRPAYVDYDDDIEPEEKSLEKVNFDEERINKIYEDAKKLAFNRPSLEESVKLADTNTTFGKFKEFEVKEQSGLLAEYTKDLRDLNGFKKAFILSEVLNRKHF